MGGRKRRWLAALLVEQRLELLETLDLALICG
jgi:hypothetical protein